MSEPQVDDWAELLIRVYIAVEDLLGEAAGTKLRAAAEAMQEELARELGYDVCQRRWAEFYKDARGDE